MIDDTYKMLKKGIDKSGESSHKIIIRTGNYDIFFAKNKGIFMETGVKK